MPGVLASPIEIGGEIYSAGRNTLKGTTDQIPHILSGIASNGEGGNNHATVWVKLPSAGHH